MLINIPKSRIFLIFTFFGILILHLLSSIIFRHSDFVFIILFSFQTLLLFFLCLSFFKLKFHYLTIFFFFLSTISFLLFVFETGLFLVNKLENFNNNVEKEIIKNDKLDLSKENANEHDKKIIIEDAFIIGIDEICSSIDDQLLGYKPRQIERSCKNITKEHQVIYHYHKNGFRYDGKNFSNKKKNIALFLGGSFTFGQGLNWQDTLPAKFSKLQKSYHSLNYGWPGWGPHHSYILLEKILNFKDEDIKPKICIFQTAPWHIPRSSGYTQWDRFGPKFEIKNNELVYQGNFASRYTIRLLDIANRSAVWKLIYPHIGNLKNIINKKDIDLYISLVDGIVKECKDQFNAKTIVIYWDEEINKNDYAGYSNKEILNLMKKTISNDGSILVVSKVLDILDPKMRTFDLHHPSGLANEKLSFAILNNL